MTDNNKKKIKPYEIYRQPEDNGNSLLTKLLIFIAFVLGGFLYYFFRDYIINGREEE